MNGKRKKINSILLQFDFRAVKDVMINSNITWTKDEIEYIPSEADLRLKAEEMLKACTDSETSYCMVSGNGFIAVKRATSLELSYVIDRRWA